MTLSLFGAPPWPGLWDDRPIVSGVHPLHLYHGSLGARALLDTGRPCCYDPAFQAGYPKTPVFDSGSRPAELFLLTTGGRMSAAAYKIGLAACCCFVPVLLLAGARGAGLSLGAASLATALGLFVWWGAPARSMFEAGDVDGLLGGLAGAAHVGLLIRFHHAPGLGNWLGILATACIGWLIDPSLFLLLGGLGLVYYLSVGPRHRLGWHAALGAAWCGAVFANSFWLTSWLRSWWLRLPLELGGEALTQHTLQGLWSAPQWGEPADRALAVALLGIAAIGVILLNQNGQRLAARLLGFGAGGCLALVSGGLMWEGLGRLGTARLLAPALWFACVPAVYALAQLSELAARRTRVGWVGAVLSGGLITVALLATGQETIKELAGRCARSAPLDIGLGPEREALVDMLRSHTTPEARILWEERLDAPTASRWTALLPPLTERWYLGGLGPDVCIEHSYPGLVEGSLAGRPLKSWTDAELETFCRRYNVGWAACWSRPAVRRLQTFKAANLITALPGSGFLFSLPGHSYILKGAARILQADCRRIALADVVPEDGKVVLSLHHQAGMQASPDRVGVEREPDPYDPIPFIRLRVPGPAARVTITVEPR
jgi:hypothetical protein